MQQSLSRIRQHMGERQTVQELPPQLQAEVFNEQERINTLLARGHEDNRDLQVRTHHRQQHAQEPLPDRGRTAPDRKSRR